MLLQRSARLDVQYVQLRPSRGIKWGGSFRGRKEQAAGDGWRVRGGRGQKLTEQCWGV